MIAASLPGPLREMSGLDSNDRGAMCTHAIMLGRMTSAARIHARQDKDREASVVLLWSWAELYGSGIIHHLLHV